jgi:hypothetical protein
MLLRVRAYDTWNILISGGMGEDFILWDKGF